MPPLKLGNVSSAEITATQPVFRARHGNGGPAEHRYNISEVILGEHLGLQYEAQAAAGLPQAEIYWPGAGPRRLRQVGANLLLRPKDQRLTAAALPIVPLKQLDCRPLPPRLAFRLDTYFVSTGRSDKR